MLTACLLLLFANAPEHMPAPVPAEPVPAPAAAPLAAGPIEAPAPGIPDPPPEDADGKWHGSLDLGASVASGNSDTVSASASSTSKKEWEMNRVTLKASWNFAQQEDEITRSTDVTQRRWSAMGKYDRFWTARNYAFGSVAAENDDIADLHLRTIYATGVGRKLLIEEDLKLDGEAGISWIDEDYVGQVDDDHFFALRLATDLDYTISENTKFLQTAEMFPSVDFSEFNGTLDSRLRINMTATMFAQIQWVARYNNNAPPGTGSTDNLWIASLGWTY